MQATAANSEIVALASSCTLGEPMQKDMRHLTTSKEVKRNQHMKQNDNYAIAPYQAMPVTGPVVTKEAKTSGLPVVEPDHSVSPEVSVLPLRNVSVSYKRWGSRHHNKRHQNTNDFLSTSSCLLHAGA